MHTDHRKNVFYVNLQVSIFAPFIFNILLCDLFYFLQGVKVASYADGTTAYSTNKTNEMKEIDFSEVLLNNMALSA